MYYLAIAELSYDQLNHKRESGDMFEKNPFGFDDMFSNQRLVLESCEIQKHVLSQLRSLVVSSIEQVKMCLANE